MIRKLLLASVGAIALSGSAALAADLPSRAPPPAYIPPAPIFTWTGIYVGGQIGYAWSSGNNNFNGFDPFFPGTPYLVSSVGGTPNGVIGGANVGYNYQINQWVLGIEGDVNGTSLSNTAVAAFPDGTSLSVHSTSDIQGSIRGRLGVAWDRALIYATGGVAFGGFNTDVTLANSVVPFFGSGSVSTTRVGWTVGGGIQYAVTNNWSVRAEYRYTDWGNINDGTFGGFAAAPGAYFDGNRRINQNQVQVGFDYKFDLFAPPPIVAKY
ncbi:MAG TPA: outer membrane protein [Methylocella sp.]|nr:outer membrane protein [Methylocella sp.]